MEKTNSPLMKWKRLIYLGINISVVLFGIRAYQCGKPASLEYFPYVVYYIAPALLVCLSFLLSSRPFSSVGGAFAIQLVLVSFSKMECETYTGGGAAMTEIAVLIAGLLLCLLFSLLFFITIKRFTGNQPPSEQ